MKHTFSKTYSLLLFLALCILLSTAHGQLNLHPLNLASEQTVSKELSLQTLIDSALKNNPRIAIASQQFAQGRGRLTQAKSGYLPHLEAQVGYSRMHIDAQRALEDDVASASLNLSQLIYDFGKTTGGIDAARFQLMAAESNLLQLRRDVLFQLKRAYYDVLEKNRLIGVASEAVTTYEQHVIRANAYLDAGVRTQIDVTNAEVVLSNARLALMRSQYNLKTSRVRLEQILGIQPYNGDYTLQGALDNLDGLADSMPVLPHTLEDMLSMADQQRADLAQYRSFIAAAEAGVNRAQGGYFPTIGAKAGYDAFNSDLPVNDEWQVGVGLTWQLFSGFATEGDVVEAKGILLESKAAFQTLHLAAVQQVTDSYLRADESRESVIIAEQTLALAAENLQLAEERYKAGIGDMIEFNDAQLNHIRAQSDLVVSYFTYLASLARIENAVGTANFNQDGGLQ